MKSGENTETRWRGVADSATDADWLEMTPQYKGITEYIKRCQTPMTIAIQGDWGVGKTSAMKNIEKAIKDEGQNPCIWFKTWQFSVLKDNQNITLEFMLTLLDKLGEMVREIRIIHTLGLLLDAAKEKKNWEIIKKCADDIAKKQDKCIQNPEKLDGMLQQAWNTIKNNKLNNTKLNSVNEYVEKLEGIRDSFAKNYDIPIKEIEENNAAKTSASFLDKCRDALQMVNKNKLKIARVMSSFVFDALKTGAEKGLPGGAGMLLSMLLNRAEGAVDGFMKSPENGAASTDEADCFECQNNQSTTLFLVDICNEINRIIHVILDYYGEKDNRICIFVDDLDRLQPQIALELLEGLKNFVEYQHCVFILAIDKAVIDQGLRSKYDETFLFGKRDKESGRNRADKFFDKIIQVPFTLPEKSYDIGKYMKKLLKQDNGELVARYKAENKATYEEYATLLRKLDIYNPRSIKRCFNLQALYDCMSLTNADIAKDAFIKNNKEWYDVCYFAITILQIENREAYNRMLSIILLNEKDTTGAWEEMEKCCQEPENQHIAIVLEQFQEAMKKIKDVDAEEKVRKWLVTMLTSSNYNNSFSEKEIYIKRLRDIINELDNDNKAELDLTIFRERFSKSDKELAENFGSYLMAEEKQLCLKMGWGRLARPYIMVSMNGQDIKDILTGVESFEEYSAGMSMANSKNYYLVNETKELTIYTSPVEKWGKECLTVLRGLGYLSQRN